MSKAWQRLSSEVQHRFRIFDILAERYVSPRTQQPIDVVVLDCRDWVNVVGLTAEEEVVMIRQFRFGTGAVTLEIPGGIVDAGESPFEAAKRELREETGYAAARWTPLGAVSPNPAIHRNRLHLFLAEGCTLAGEQEQDPGEDIAVELMPLDEVTRLLAAGDIDHALVAVALQKVALQRTDTRRDRLSSS